VRELVEEIDVAAPPDAVWAVLTDFAAYGEWNPFVVAIEGEPRVGERLRVRLQPPGARALTIRPRLLEVTPDRALRWLGHLGVRGLFDGEHSFELVPNGAGTHFVHRERFTGALVPVVWSRVGPPTREGFRAMNEALRERAEASAGPA
jgi:hypothetical protein